MSKPSIDGGVRRAMSHALTSITLACACALVAPAAMAAGTPDPGDYVPAPAGANVLALYAQRLQADKVYADGRRQPGDLWLRLDVGVARYMHYFELGGRTADVEFILPFGRQRVDSADYRESGIGNLTVGASLWTLSDEAAGRHLGWAAYLTMPTGQKRDRGFFASEDRWALDVEGGYVTKLAERVSLDLIGQAEVYTRDDTTQVSRSPMLRGFVHLSYHLSDATRLAVSLRQTFGARESLAGATVSGRKNDSNLMLTWAWQATETLQWQLQYAADVKVRNGAAVKGLQGRLVYAF